MSRDYDVLDAIAAALEATNEFDAVYRSALPETSGQRSADQLAACVAPRDWEDIDDASDIEVKRSVRWTLTLIVREDDANIRERTLDRLANVAMTALDGQCLAGITLPGWTKLRRGTYETANAPEQRMTCVGEFVYLVNGFGGHDVSP